MTLLNVLSVPSVKINLLSINKFIQKGAILLANEEKMQIKKDRKTITLPCKQESGGNMYCLNAKRIVGESINDVGTTVPTKELSKEKTLPKTLDINVAHDFCHLGEKILRVTHTGDMYRMYNPGTERIILSRDVTWGNWDRTDPRKNMDIFVAYDSTDTVPGVDEVIVDVKNLGEKDSMAVRSLPDNESGEKLKIMKNDKIESKLETTKLERELKKLDISYNPMARDTEENPIVRDGNVVVTGEVNPLPIEIPKEETSDFVELHNTSVTSDVGDPKSFDEAIKCIRGQLWKLSMIVEVNIFLYRKARIPKKLAVVRDKGRKPIPVKWVFKTKLEPDGSEQLKLRIVTKGYLQVPGVDFTESFSPVATDCSMRIIVGITLYFSEGMDWVCEAFDIEAAFLEPCLDIEMYIEWPVGMVELGFLTEEEYESTCVQLQEGGYRYFDPRNAKVRFCSFYYF